MATIDHVTIRTSDLEASLKLFTQVFELLDFRGQRHEGDGFYEWNDFSIAAADAEHPPTRNVHIGFAANSPRQVDDWWRAMTASGYTNDGAPGPRPEYSPSYYGAFIRDHDNNSIEAVTHDDSNPDGAVIDHLWIRVRDLDANKGFYSGIASAIGLRLRERHDRIQLITDRGSFSVLSDQPTENLHLALGVDSRDTVADFHRAGCAAGGRDNGQPGERPQYHPGYFGAYLLDPAGNNIEAVFHDRH